MPRRKTNEPLAEHEMEAIADEESGNSGDVDASSSHTPVAFRIEVGSLQLNPRVGFDGVKMIRPVEGIYRTSDEAEIAALRNLVQKGIVTEIH